jgi:hypothetical protein
MAGFAVEGREQHDLVCLLLAVAEITTRCRLLPLLLRIPRSRSARKPSGARCSAPAMLVVCQTERASCLTTMAFGWSEVPTERMESRLLPGSRCRHLPPSNHCQRRTVRSAMRPVSLASSVDPSPQRGGDHGEVERMASGLPDRREGRHLLAAREPVGRLGPSVLPRRRHPTVAVCRWCPPNTRREIAPA